METDILAIANRLRVAIKNAGGNLKISQQTGIALGSINNYLGAKHRLPFSVAVQLSQACGVSLDWLATGEEAAAHPRAHVDLDQLTNDVIDAHAEWREGGPDGYGRWEQVFDVLKAAFGQSNALPPMLRSVATDQQAVANAEDRAVVTPQAATARTDDIETCFVLTLPPEMQQALLRSAYELAIEGSDGQIGAHIRGFIRAATFIEGI